MVTSFPQMPGLINSAFDIFQGSSKVLLQVAPLVFLVRVLLIKIMFQGRVEYFFLIRDLIYLFVGFFCFEQLIRFVLEIPSFADSLLGSRQPLELETFKDSSFWSMVSMKSTEFMALVSAVIFWIMNFLYLLFMALMIALGAYIIFFSTMFKMKWVLSVFFITLMLISSWPFFWYAVDQTATHLLREIDKTGSEWGLIISGLGVGLCKILIPLATFFYALKDPVNLASGLSSGVSRGLMPATASAGAAKNLTTVVATKASSSVGFDRVVKGHLAPRIERLKNVAAKPAQVLRDAAPFAAYNLKKGLNTLSFTKAGASDNAHNFSFKDYTQKLDQVSTTRRRTRTANKKSETDSYSQESETRVREASKNFVNTFDYMDSLIQQNKAQTSRKRSFRYSDVSRKTSDHSLPVPNQERGKRPVNKEKIPFPEKEIEA